MQHLAEDYGKFITDYIILYPQYRVIDLTHVFTSFKDQTIIIARTKLIQLCTVYTYLFLLTWAKLSKINTDELFRFIFLFIIKFGSHSRFTYESRF